MQEYLIKPNTVNQNLLYASCSDRAACTFEYNVKRDCHPWAETRWGKQKYSPSYLGLRIDVQISGGGEPANLFKHIPKAAKVKPGQLEIGLWPALDDTIG